MRIGSADEAADAAHAAHMQLGRGFAAWYLITCILSFHQNPKEK
jgi:hypothetical protein